jgi:hypothetical protein
MKTYVLITSGILFAALANVAAPVPAQAKTEKECAAEWKQMKDANQTAGKKRKDFITECRGTTAAPGAATPPAAAPAPASPPPAAAAPPPPAPAPAAKPAVTAKPPATPAPVATGNIVFPSAVSAKYSTESAGKGRMHTCRDQYEANKATNANGGLKWIEKGGGYYSECNKHLKG